MKNLFNNPWFVSALSLLAMTYLVVQVMGYLPGNDPTSGDMSADVFEPEVDEVNSVVRTSSPDSGGRVDRKLVGWLKTPSRDPFRSRDREQEPTLGAAHDTSPLRPVPSASRQLPRLQAVFHRGHEASAVINGQLVGIGDSIDGYQVSRIAPSSVGVTRSGIPYTLIPEKQ